MKEHTYKLVMEWTGNTGEGTRTYRGYKRDHSISIEGKPDLLCSSDPNFRGDPSRYNPEELLVASLSSCHMLWYLHLCSENQVNVVAYKDTPIGWMQEHEDGSGEFTRVELRPMVRVAAGSDAAKAHALHTKAHHLCFIARSMNFPVEAKPEIVIA